MADRYSQLINTPIGKLLAKQVGLPAPTPLERYTPGQPLIAGSVLLGAAPNGRLQEPAAQVLEAAHVTVDRADGAGELAPRTPPAKRGSPRRHSPATGPARSNAEPEPQEPRKALVFDATGIASSQQLSELHAFFHPTVRSLERCGRVVVLGTPPDKAANPSEAIAQRALEGFTRALGKEIRRGATVQLVYVQPGAEDELAATLRFLLSPRSAYVSGQVVRIGERIGPAPDAGFDWERPFAGKVALVTGASRGIGAAIAATLARDGAHVVGLDVPALADDLEAVTSGLGGSALTADITDDQAPQQIADHLRAAHGRVDVVVHNAGITRDKTLGRMDADRWNAVIEVNLNAIQRVHAALADGRKPLLGAGGRVVCVSSISGIAGNAGQTNYATSKAGVIGIVDAFAPLLAKQGATINAVAPGFIETQMTARIPLATREVGRRMNSLSQGGLPLDVAETIAWFASPASGGVTGNVVRVCGQSLIGA